MKRRQDIQNLQKLFKTIQQCMDGFDFTNILSRLKLEYTFKNITQYVEEISQDGSLNNFVIVCYKMVIVKIIYDWYLQQQQEKIQHLRYNQVLQILNQYALKLSNVIKQQYCVVMEKITNKKSQTIQLVIFLICISTRLALSIFYKNFDILRYYLFQQVQTPGDGIQTLACMLINFEITGIKLTPTSYLSLKKKYCLKIKARAKQHKNKTQLISNLIQFFPMQKKNMHQQNVDQCNQQQSQDELKNLFSEQKTKSTDKRILNKNKQINNYVNHKSQKLVFSGREEFPIKIFGVTGLKKNSDAFKQNRTNFLLSKNCEKFINQSKNSFRKQDKTIINAQAYKKQKQKQKRDLTMAIISQSLSHFFFKVDKKNFNKESSKLTVAEWSKKIKNMQQQGSLEKVTLKKPGDKWRKATQYCQQQCQKNFQYIRYSTSRETRNQHAINYMKRNHIRQGFCEYIDQRQPKQMGIVKGVVNYTATSKQSKHKKTSSREMKLQYQEFSKKMEEHQQRRLNENNFVFRLQKALTGTNKI